MDKPVTVGMNDTIVNECFTDQIVECVWVDEPETPGMNDNMINE